MVSSSLLLDSVMTIRFLEETTNFRLSRKEHARWSWCLITRVSIHYGRMRPCIANTVQGFHTQTVAESTRIDLASRTADKV